MDPITIAIAAALGAGAAGALKGTTEVGKRAIVDSYEGLKNLIKTKFGEGSKVDVAVKELEDSPDSESRKGVLGEELSKLNPGQDPEILAAAEKLMEYLKADPTIVPSVTQTAIGTGIAQATGSGNATVNMGSDAIKSESLKGSDIASDDG